MAALPPSVAAVRAAVRSCLSGVRPPRALVACSGGADSLALATATAFVAPRFGVHCGLVTVDHGLQDGSAERASTLAGWARAAGFDPVLVVPVEVAGRPGGPEAAAREARYEALLDAAKRSDASAVLLGHTRDDQAETVLLALARGAGPRGLAGMPARRDVDGVALLRPLLDVSRADTVDTCATLGLDPWMDPHNSDPGYARARVRQLVEVLGAAVVDNLARTASLVAADNAVLDGLAAGAAAGARHPDGGLTVAALADLPAAVRTRVLHGWARELGAPGGDLSHRHVAALDALVTAWCGQGPTYLPGGIAVSRKDGRLDTDNAGGGS